MYKCVPLKLKVMPNGSLKLALVPGPPSPL